jgi:hypothetical protein
MQVFPQTKYGCGAILKRPGLPLKVRVLSSKARRPGLIIAAAAIVLGIAASPSTFRVINALLLYPNAFSQFDCPPGVNRFPSGGATHACHSAEDDQLSPDVSQFVAQCGSDEEKANPKHGQTISPTPNKARRQKRFRIALASMLITVKADLERRGFCNSWEKINTDDTVIPGCDNREAVSPSYSAALNGSLVIAGKPFGNVKVLSQPFRLPVELRISTANRSGAVHCNEAK